MGKNGKRLTLGTMMNISMGSCTSILMNSRKFVVVDISEFRQQVRITPVIIAPRFLCSNISNDSEILRRIQRLC